MFGIYFVKIKFQLKSSSTWQQEIGISKAKLIRRSTQGRGTSMNSRERATRIMRTYGPRSRWPCTPAARSSTCPRRGTSSCSSRPRQIGRGRRCLLQKSGGVRLRDLLGRREQRWRATQPHPPISVLQRQMQQPLPELFFFGRPIQCGAEIIMMSRV